MFHKHRCFSRLAPRELFLAVVFKSEYNYKGNFSLSGGFENFLSQYPELCTEVRTVDHSGPETEKRVNSQTEARCNHKPDYDQVWKHPHRALPRVEAPAQLWLFLNLPGTTWQHQGGLRSHSAEQLGEIHFHLWPFFCSAAQITKKEGSVVFVGDGLGFYLPRGNPVRSVCWGS